MLNNEPQSTRVRRELAVHHLVGPRRTAPPPDIRTFHLPPPGSLRWFWLDGLFASISDSLVLTYVPLYALSFGASGAQIGLLSSAASLLGTAVLLPGARLAEALGRRKELVLLATGLARLTLLLLALVPFDLRGAAAVTAIVILNALRAMLGSLALPAWTSLSADLVPEAIRGRYFSARNLAIGVAAVAGVPLGGLLINRLTFPTGYQLDFALAFLTGVAATVSYWRIREPRGAEPLVVRSKQLPVWERLRRRPNFLWFCVMTLIWTFGLQVAAPFFNVYLVKVVGASTAAVGWVTMVTGLTALPAQRLWGQMADRWGSRRTLLVAGLGIPLLPWAWLFVSSPWHVVPINILSGLAWSGFNLASFNFLLAATPDDRRSRYVALYNIVVGIATTLGATAGGLIVDLFSYQAAFFTSGLFRALALVVLVLFIAEPRQAPEPLAPRAASPD